jgi:hypothetical protein
MRFAVRHSAFGGGGTDPGVIGFIPAAANWESEVASAAAAASGTVEILGRNLPHANGPLTPFAGRSPSPDGWAELPAFRDLLPPLVHPTRAGQGKELPNPARMDTTAMDTIAGAKLLRARFQSRGFQPDQAVMHGDRRATFIRMDDGAAIIRHWGDSHAVAVPPDSLSLPSPKRR